MNVAYYVRWRGQILGPMSDQRLKAMIQRGEVSSMHEVSTDGLAWVQVREVPGLLTVTAQGPAAPLPGATLGAPLVTNIARAGLSAEPSTASQWFYNDGSGNVGPMAKDQILLLYQQGQISQRALVWQPDWPTWRPIVTEFPTAPPTAETKSSRISHRDKSDPAPSAATIHDLTAKELVFVRQELEIRGKSQLATYLLWLFLGIWISAHRFYLGKVQSAILYIVLGWIPRTLSIPLWMLWTGSEEFHGVLPLALFLELVCLGVSLWMLLDLFFIPQMWRESRRRLEQDIISEVLAARR